MAEVDLLEKYPKTSRPVEHRSQASEEDRRLAKRFEKEYFDGTRQQGYGGYVYDGRWKPVVQSFIQHYGLSANSKLLDVGCAKGFMLFDFMQALPGVTVAGVDISRYALGEALPEVKPFLTQASCEALPYPDHSFDLVISIATIHNCDLEGVKSSLKEIMRVTKKYAFIKVNGFKTPQEELALHQWNVVAKTILPVEAWQQIFHEVGYTGDYYWFTP